MMEMPEGAALDEAVATEVMGWHIEMYHRYPPFSVDTPEGWAAMRTVVERMAELMPSKTFTFCYYPLFDGTGTMQMMWLANFDGAARAPTLPAAVALAALAACRQEAKDA